MTMNNLTRSILLSGSLAVSVFAQPTPAPKPPRTPIFISPDLANDVALITPPPALDSPKMSKDVAEIYAIHRTANAQEFAKAKFDNDHEDIFAIASVLSDKMNKETLPATAALWADMNNDESIVVGAAKKYFQHPRPYDLDPNLKSICGSKPGGPKNSYPSGHGTTGYLSAAVLSMMVPEKAAILHARADEYGHSRVVCGDHYTADIPASKEAAGLILGNMLGSAKFQQEFAASKLEIRRVLGL